MARWTLRVIRHRKAIIAAWIALFVVGGAAAANLGDLLSNRFSVPGSDAERGLTLLKDHMHERSDGAFTLVVQGQGGAHDRRLRADLDPAREPGRRQADAEAAQGDRHRAWSQDLPDRLSRAQPRHP